MKTSEHAEQVALFRWAEFAVSRWPVLTLMHAIPNGGLRNKVTVLRLKAEGVKPGVPDICLPVPSGRFHGLYIKLKTQRGRLSDGQRQWIAALVRHGYRAEVCHGWEAARAVIKDYLGLAESAPCAVTPKPSPLYPSPRNQCLIIPTHEGARHEHGHPQH